jgi:CheY-like chemotaxis protein
MPINALIVDDDQMNAEIITHALSAIQISSTMLNDPAELPGTLQQSTDYQIVFLDLEMPNMNGYEALEIVKRDLGAQVPVVAYTVHLSEANVAADKGFDGFLAKPLDTDNFADHVQRIMNGERVWVTR